MWLNAEKFADGGHVHSRAWPRAPGHNVCLFCHRFGSNASSLIRDGGCKLPDGPEPSSGGGVGTFRLFQSEAESARASATTTLRDNQPRISQPAGTCHVSWCCDDTEENTWTQRTKRRLHNSSTLLSVATRTLLWFQCWSTTTTPAHCACSSAPHTPRRGAK